MTEMISIFNQSSVIWREIKGEIKAKEPQKGGKAKCRKLGHGAPRVKPVKLLAHSACERITQFL